MGRSSRSPKRDRDRDRDKKKSDRDRDRDRDRDKKKKDRDRARDRDNDRDRDRKRDRDRDRSRSRSPRGRDRDRNRDRDRDRKKRDRDKKSDAESSEPPRAQPSSLGSANDDEAAFLAEKRKNETAEEREARIQAERRAKFGAMKSKLAATGEISLAAAVAPVQVVEQKQASAPTSRRPSISNGQSKEPSRRMASEGAWEKDKDKFTYLSDDIQNVPLGAAITIDANTPGIPFFSTEQKQKLAAATAATANGAAASSHAPGGSPVAVLGASMSVGLSVQSIAPSAAAQAALQAASKVQGLVPPGAAIAAKLADSKRRLKAWQDDEIEGWEEPSTGASGSTEPAGRINSQDKLAMISKMSGLANPAADSAEVDPLDRYMAELGQNVMSDVSVLDMQKSDASLKTISFDEIMALGQMEAAKSPPKTIKKIKLDPDPSIVKKPKAEPKKADAKIDMGAAFAKADITQRAKLDIKAGTAKEVEKKDNISSIKKEEKKDVVTNNQIVHAITEDGAKHIDNDGAKQVDAAAVQFIANVGEKSKNQDKQDKDVDMNEAVIEDVREKIFPKF